jgi:cob(I)alamin adenosyltransferase
MADPEILQRDGDNGRTEFGRYGQLPKWDARVVASADCDEANAVIGVALSVTGFTVEVTSTLASVQNDLLDVRADLAVPLDGGEEATARIHEAHLVRLERAILHFQQEPADLDGIVLPGGTVAAATLYHARAVVRRAERMAWVAYDAHPEGVSVLTAQYLNRLSALLFVLARGANVEHGDIYWQPEASSRAMEVEPEGD